ncbi:hypothetical protein PRIC2_003805 [Phytophthora ramorum]
MGKLAASPAKMQMVLPPVFGKPAVSAGANEVVVQDAVMVVARQLLAEYKTPLPSVTGKLIYISGLQSPPNESPG